MNIGTTINILLFTINISACQMFDNQNNLKDEFYSPTHNLKIVVFEKKGNATTNNSIHVSLEMSNYQLENTDTGNFFIADQIDSHNQTATQLIQANWKNNDTIQIHYPQSIRIFKKENQIKIRNNSIIIKYILK
jgi:hypothetical protein